MRILSKLTLLVVWNIILTILIIVLFISVSNVPHCDLYKLERQIDRNSYNISDNERMIEVLGDTINKLRGEIDELRDEIDDLDWEVHRLKLRW